MGDKLKRLLSKDLDEAFKKAREEERALCSVEHQSARDVEKMKLEGEYILKIKLLEQTVDSLKRQLKGIDEREKNLFKEQQQVKEDSVIQRRLASDLVALAERKNNYEADIFQEFVRIKQAIVNSERKIIGMNMEDE